MDRDPRVDPQFGDELLCVASEARIRISYSEPFVLRVAAYGENRFGPAVEVLTRRETGVYWRHMSLSADVYYEVAAGATVTLVGGEGQGDE